MTGVFATAAGGSPNYVALSSFAAVWSIGVGGNLPVDSAVFLGKYHIPRHTLDLAANGLGDATEFVPASHQYLLTVLSIWWAFGQLLASLVAWPLIGNYSCPTPPANGPITPCPKSSNQGWRYFLYAMGGLMLLLWVFRFFVFNLHESPKYLMGRGKDADAVEIVHKVAQYNGVTSNLTVEELDRAGKYGWETENAGVDTSALGAIKRRMSMFSGDHIRALFATRKLAWSTSILIVLWGMFSRLFSSAIGANRHVL